MMAFRRQAMRLPVPLVAILAIGFGQIIFALHHHDSEPHDGHDGHGVHDEHCGHDEHGELEDPCSVCALTHVESLPTPHPVATAKQVLVVETVNGVGVDARPKQLGAANPPRGPPLS